MVDIKSMLNGIAFIFTIFMALYGFVKGFDTVELVTNLLYFTVMVIVTFIDLIEQLRKR